MKVPFSLAAILLKLITQKYIIKHIVNFFMAKMPPLCKNHFLFI